MTMKNTRTFWRAVGACALLAVIGLGMTSCATYATRSGVTTPVGSLTPAGIIGDRPVIAEYTIILGLFTVGYHQFLRATQGREIDIVTWSLPFFVTRVRAVPRY